MTTQRSHTVQASNTNSSHHAQHEAKSSKRSAESHITRPVPAAERHGKPFSQFTLWLGGNLQITAIVNGALAVVFGVHPAYAILGLLIGNLLGATFTALHAGQGSRFGLPQMILSRAEFGIYGAMIPLVLIVLMYLGFAATGSVLAGQAVNMAFSIESKWVGILIFGGATILVAIAGHRWIHKLSTISSWFGFAMLAYITIQIFRDFDVPALFNSPQFNLPMFLLAMSLSAGWQLTYSPYVADYTRFLPEDTSRTKIFWCTFGGLVTGSQLSMMLGVVLAALPTAAEEGFMENQVGFMGTLAGGGLIALAVYLIIFTGKLCVNTLNAYGGTITILTTVSAFVDHNRVNERMRSAVVTTFITISVLIALFASRGFLDNFKNFILLLLTVFTPWNAINLVYYFIISKGYLCIDELFDPQGRYGLWNIPCLVTYAIGVAVQIPFLNTTLYTGPMVEYLDGADISWIIGLLVPGVIFATWGRKALASHLRTP